MRLSVSVFIAGFVCLFTVCDCQSKKVSSKSGKNGLNDTINNKGSNHKVLRETDKQTSLPLKVNFNDEVNEVSKIAEKPPKLDELKQVSKTAQKPPKLVCPVKGSPRPLFSLRCSSTSDCAFLGKGLLCCDKRCIKGVNPPKAESKHSPIFFGMIQRVCPVEPTPEIWAIQECKSDSECEPRICCPEAMKNGEIRSFCRMAQPVWDSLPAPRQIIEPIKVVIAYMQCTPPPPPFLDLFPKTCNNPLDCFPNLCCQEKGRKFCRPPKRSLLSLIAGIGQRFIPENAARKLIERIS